MNFGNFILLMLKFVLIKHVIFCQLQLIMVIQLQPILQILVICSISFFLPCHPIHLLPVVIVKIFLRYIFRIWLIPTNFYQNLSNCITTCSIPHEWKSAILTPLFKGKKQDPNDINSYRGISVLPPLAKVFEKILATQIIIYLNINNLFYPSQHGFRNAHSCESAIHEIISEMNEARSKRLIGLYLFIDFKLLFLAISFKS